MSHGASVVVFMVLSIIIAVSKSDQDENCDRFGIHFYEEIGCQAVSQNDTKCPIKYTCPDLSLSSEKCLFQKRTYPLRGNIDNDITYASCNVGCYCNEGPKHASFTCAILDCPEYFNGPPDFGCYRTYEPGKCCSVGQKCPKSEAKDVAKCEVEGKTYWEGLIFYPKGTCLKCVCTKDFDGTFGKSYCRKQTCATQLRHSEQIANKCAPVYLHFGEPNAALCCPNQFVCPSASDKIEQVVPQDASKSELRCSYGERELKYGEGFKAKVDQYGPSRDVQCTCLLPPLVQCIEI